jgi:hypothetical protein
LPICDRDKPIADKPGPDKAGTPGRDEKDTGDLAGSFFLKQVPEPYLAGSRFGGIP